MEPMMDATGLDLRLDRIDAQLAALAAESERRADTYAELAPVLREVLATATARLDVIEKKGWLDTGRALAQVAERVLDHYTADDVRALGDAIVSILDTVRALTQPQALALIGEVGETLSHPGGARPVSLLGMMRASRDDDVKKGMGIVVELLRHVGRAARASVADAAPAQLDRKAKLAAALGPRRKVAADHLLPAPVRAAPRPVAPAPPPPAAVVAGVALGPDGHLADPGAWTREVAERLAAAAGIVLTPERWALIERARADFLERGAAPNIRRLTQVAGVTTKDIFALFPRAPGRTIARLAGTPKPAGCI
jgi:tRNA 2-thiouridine synthesizing protein E